MRQRGTIDQVLGRFSKKPLHKLQTQVLNALRIGAFQLLYLDRIPASAAINETVKALKVLKYPQWITGFVNGILRNLDRNRETLSSEKCSAAERNHPDWLVEKWQKQYGRKPAEHMCAINDSLPDLTLRVRDKVELDDYLSSLHARGVTAEKGAYAPRALHIKDWKGGITELPGFEEGFFQVQDEAAQLVSLLLAPFEKGRYLDGCAGLGGKTTHVRELLTPVNELVAVEPQINRYNLLQENLGRFDMSTSVQTMNNCLDALLSTAKHQFQGILLDAPCSGTGVIRRHPDIRWSRKEQDLAGYQDQQRKLLETAARLLKQMGILVYATCSIEPEENEQVIKEFLHGHKDFVLSNAADYLPRQAADLVDAEGFFRSLPDRNIDGFFAARLQRIKTSAPGDNNVCIGS